VRGSVRRAPAWLAIVALAAALAGCGHSDASSGGSGGGSAAASKTLTVFAASSLTGAFQELGKQFEAAHQGVKVQFSFGGSSDLVAQIQQGAPADVFASADQANMDKLTKASLNGTPPVVFATNLLSIIVAKGNPKVITGVADLAKPGLKVVLCADGVPCGTYAEQILASAKVDVTPVSLEQNVKGVVTKVTTGEADAGIVYQTDVKAAGDAAAGVAIPTDINVVANYPIASVKTSTQTAVDQAFIAFLTSADGQAFLAQYGFGPKA
jgi:molybdate transport system substrate-binding protein